MDQDELNLNIDSTDKLIQQMKTDYAYPLPDDPNFQDKIFEKREFYYHKLNSRNEMKSYEDVKDYRDKLCSRKFALYEHQALLSNYINPDTPYKGVLICHGTGTGKCLTKDQLVDLNNELVKIEDVWSKFKSNITVTETKEEGGGEWALPNSTMMYVKSLDEKTGKLVIRPVKRLYKQFINEKINVVKLENGSVISITKQHKLYTERGWSNNIISAEYVLTPAVKSKIYTDFEFVKIESVIEVDYNDYVYDLEVEEHHNFIAQNILVSNTCVGIAIAEKFKQMVQKYGTKIYVLVSGPLVKENWKNELIKCTGDTYLAQQDATSMVTDAEKNKLMKNAVNTAMQYYRFMSYRSFYRKVLGEKIREGVRTNDDKVKTVYRKTKEGDFERDLAIDRIINLNNSVIIVDEAHHLTGNNYGEALMKIIRNSYNLKIILLSATPMKNLAEDIIGLLNYLRPIDNPVLRDKVFTTNKNYMMDFKQDGLEYLKKMATGYVSYLRGADPLTFAKRVEQGVIPKGLLFTPIVQCKMLQFQQTAYDEAVEEIEDTLDRKSASVANFAIPGLSPDKKKLIGLYGRKGIIEVKNQIKTHFEKLNKMIAEDILKIEDAQLDMINIADNDKTITGEILKLENLKHFSIKFYTTLKNLNRLVNSDKGARTAFVYSNLVKVGIELFEEILRVNGYLEFNEDPSTYKISPNTVCYLCGKSYSEHKDVEISLKKLDHEYHPATFITVTGKSSEDVGDTIPEEKKYVLDNYFSQIQNKEGKYIKFVLGSKVMSEAISLKNVAEVHILDVYFNLGQVDQVIGRAIRGCSHYGLINDNYRYPEVLVYKYAVTLDPNKGLSSEEELYRKAEQKYIMIKKVERVLKEVAIDCPLLRNGNIFPEELSKYKGCVEPDKKTKDDQVICPALCDYVDCNYKCNGDKLNRVYYDEKTNDYKSLTKDELDYTTFTKALAKNEIEHVKNKVKELYRVKYVYTLDYIIKYVKKSYSKDKAKLFDEFFVYKALDELIPVSENDFNNFKDTVYDKYNRSGYIIYIDKYYIFQPFDQNEDVPMYYRSTYNKQIDTNLTLYNYLKSSDKFKEVKDKTKKKSVGKEQVMTNYTFNTDYYDKRPEYKYVGIIDKESSRRKNKAVDELIDVFKIREKRNKILEKKRGTGIPSFKGAVCTSKEKEYGEKVAKLLNIKFNKADKREQICELIKEKMLFLERYSTGKDKMTYIMVPDNHKSLPFPLNVEDRVDDILAKIKDKIKFTIDLKKTPIKQTVKGQSVTTYTITVKKNSELNEFTTFFKQLGAVDEKSAFVININ